MFNKFITYIRTKKYMVKVLRENSEYIHPGEYTFDDSLTYIFLKDDYTCMKCNEMFGGNFIKPFYKKVVFLLKKLFFNKTILIENQSDKKVDFLGTACFIGIAKDSNLKIFDFRNNRVLTIFSNKDKYKNTLNNYLFFKEYLPVPEINYINNNNLLFIEEFIEMKTINNWSKDDYLIVIDDIFMRYLNYFKTAKKRGEFHLKSPLSYIGGINEDKRMHKFITKYIEKKLLNSSFPHLRLHGDLWAPNILVSKLNSKKIKYIDFEYADDYVIFYDFFWFIYDQALNYKNNLYIYKYFDGCYDNYFKKVFQIFDIEFLIEHREDYFNIFFVSLYFKRWRKRTEKYKDFQLNNYLNIIASVKKR